MDFINPMKQQKKIADYNLHHSIGRGRFATVYKAFHAKTKRPFAVKVIPKKLCEQNKLLFRQLRREADIMRALAHPHLLRLHNCFESERNFYLVLDFCDRGDLAQFMARHRIERLSEEEALWVMRQVLDGFRELRRASVVHRDLKLENILLRGSKILVGDFGAAKVVTRMTSTTVGTPLNMAPEVLAGDRYDSRSDLWSIGVVLYQLLLGKPPFFALSLGELNGAVRNQAGENLDLGKEPPFCADVARLLKRLLEPDMRRRISWEELLTHDVFSDQHAKNCSCHSAETGGNRLALLLEGHSTGNQSRHRYWLTFRLSEKWDCQRHSLPQSEQAKCQEKHNRKRQVGGDQANARYLGKVHRHIRVFRIQWAQCRPSPK